MKKLVLITAAVILSTGILFAAGDNTQGAHSLTISIPEVVLLDIEGGSSISLTPSVPTEAGNPLNFATATNSTLWINYSSIVAATKSRTISAAITSGTVPTGLVLKVVAGTFSGSGKGNFGTPTTQITLGANSTPIITGVRSCYTGDGASNGHNLTYSLDLVDANSYSNLLQANTTITVTYTIGDQQ
jgi:hypothetical protein